MKKTSFFNIVVIVMIMAPFLAFTAPVQAKNQSEKEGDYVPGQLVIIYKKGKSLSQYGARTQSIAGEIQGRALKANASGLALIEVKGGEDINEVKKKVMAEEGVEAVEFNYIYSIPEPASTSSGYKLNSEYVIRQTPKGMERETEGKPFIGIPQEVLFNMKSIRSGVVKATYPTDPYLWWGGWDLTGASMVWANATASAGVCVLDTGVDYLHPDLAVRVIKGWDFVNNDADPMDDFGHGTHVAGIIAAVQNNKIGIAGVSTGKVVAVKVLGPQGWGTSYDIATGINFCANRTDVKVLNMSFGGNDISTAIYNAIDYAVNTKNKLVVAAAGNEDKETMIYPAGFSDALTYPRFENKVISVAAAGYDDSVYIGYECKANYSNYGSWVSIIAPGTAIYSTTPYDKVFYLNYWQSIGTRYDYLSGTSMATPYVAAAAARRWGYKPLETNNQIGNDLQTFYTTSAKGDGTCWPVSMDGKPYVNVAVLMDRGALSAEAYDSQTGLPLTGAKFSVMKGLTTLGTAIIQPSAQRASPLDADPSRIYMKFLPVSDVINLPATGSGSCIVKINKTGYTYGAQNAYQHGNACEVLPGNNTWVGRTGVPPLSTNFDAVVGWHIISSRDDVVNFPTLFDLNMNVWIPSMPNPLDPSQIANFIVGPEGDAFGWLENDPMGSMLYFPFARYKRDGGAIDPLPIEDVTISFRKAHPPLVANSTLPYYPGTYNIIVTDFGQTINHDNDTETPEIPLMGVYLQPYVYVWKSGAIKFYTGMVPQVPTGECNTSFWWAASVTSGVSGVVTYTPINTCTNDSGYLPYMALDCCDRACSGSTCLGK